MRRIRTLLVAAVLTTTNTGCSFIFVKGPPPPRERERTVTCTTSNVAPVVDSLIAGWQVVRTLLAIAAPESAYQNTPISRSADIGVGIGLFSLFAASSGTGFSRVSDCQDTLDDDSGPYRPRATGRRLKLDPAARKAEQREEEAAEEAAAQSRAREIASQDAKAAGDAARNALPAGPAPPPSPAPSAMPKP